MSYIKGKATHTDSLSRICKPDRSIAAVMVIHAIAAAIFLKKYLTYHGIPICEIKFLGKAYILDGQEDISFLAVNRFVS